MRNWSSALIAAALSIGSVAVAQDEPGKAPGDGPQTQERQRGDNDRRARRNRGNRRGGWMNRMMIPVEEMKEPLGLNDDQVAKLNEMNQGMRDQMRKFFEGMQRGEMPDRQAMRDNMRKGREELGAKLREILSEEQFTKYQELREQRQRRMRERWGGGRGRSSEALTKRLRDDALKALQLGDEAAALVTPLLDTVLETRKLIREEKTRRRDAFKKKVRESSDPEELTKLLKEYRSAEEADKQQLVASQDKLRELLTLQQEAKLVGLQILD